MNLTLYAIPAFIGLMLVEAVYGAWRKRQTFEAKDTLASLSMGIGSVLLSLFVKGVTFGFFWLLYEHRFFDLGTGIAAWAGIILLEDFTYYWFHRGSHEVRFLWAGHVTHHSSQHYNLSTALRQSWTPLLNLTFYWPLPLLGFHPAMILTAKSINLLYQFWIHTEHLGNLGPFGWIFNTPSHHRVHHGSNVEYLDRNHAGMLIVWDRLFGSFEPEGSPVRFGLTQNIETWNPVRIAFHEWAAIWRDVRRARSWRERLGYAFGPPGWSPEGSAHTSRALRTELEAAPIG